MERGDHEIATLIAALERSDKPILRKAVDALIPLAAGDMRLAATLNERLDDPACKNRWPIAYVLANLPSPTPSSVHILMETLDHRDPDIRWAVVLVLIRLAKTDSQILNLLIELASSGTANQRRMAIYSLRDVGHGDERSVGTLLNSLEDPEPMVRVAAVTSLKTRPELNEQGKHKILDRFLRDEDIRVRNTAAVTLAQLGTPSDEFLSALEQASVSENVQLKKAVATAFDILKKRSAPSGS